MRITVITLCALVIALAVSSIDARCFSRPFCDIKLGNKCYIHIDQSVNWNKAESCCVAWGGHLASIHTLTENYILNYIRNKDRFTWIGLSDTAKNGQYVWTDGSSFDYNNFARKQPDSAGGESCFHFFSRSRSEGELTWNDYHCTRNSWGSVKTSYICKKNFCPNLQSSKCDLVLNGKCYIFGNKRVDWHQAESCCKEWGGHLASVHSELDNFAVSSIRNSKHYTWIGLNDNFKEGTFVWTDGTKVDYKNFRRGEPNNSGKEHCVHLYANRTWNDRKCASKEEFVCVKDFTCPDCSRRKRSVMESGGNSTIEI